MNGFVRIKQKISDDVYISLDEVIFEYEETSCTLRELLFLLFDYEKRITALEKSE